MSRYAIRLLFGFVLLFSIHTVYIFFSMLLHYMNIFISLIPDDIGHDFDSKQVGGRKVLLNMGLGKKKSVFKISDQVKFKLPCSASYIR